MDATVVDKQGNTWVVTNADAADAFNFDDHIKASYKKQEYYSLYKKQAPSTVSKVIRSHFGIVRIICFERFGYEMQFKPETIKRRNRRAARLAYEEQDRQQNKYRMMHHGR
jgi:hypothetical protein